MELSIWLSVVGEKDGDMRSWGSGGGGERRVVMEEDDD